MDRRRSAASRVGQPATYMQPERLKLERHHNCDTTQITSSPRTVVIISALVLIEPVPTEDNKGNNDLSLHNQNKEIQLRENRMAQIFSELLLCVSLQQMSHYVINDSVGTWPRCTYAVPMDSEA